MKLNWRNLLRIDFNDCDNKLIQRIDEFITRNFILDSIKTRSLQQNKYYWGVIIRTLGEELGYTDMVMHDALKIKFLSCGVDKLPTTKTTKTISTHEFETFLESIRRFAASDLSISIPLPNEIEWISQTEWRFKS